MHKLIILLLILFLYGCAGVTKYTVTTPGGVQVEVYNTKDYQSYALNAKRKADGSYSIKLEEQGVSASDPMTTMADSMNKLIAIIPTAGM